MAFLYGIDIRIYPFGFCFFSLFLSLGSNEYLFFFIFLFFHLHLWFLVKIVGDGVIFLGKRSGCFSLV